MNIHNIETYFRLLGLEPGATLEDVKREHRNLLQAFHPDKFEKGSKRQEWANEKLIQLNEAVDAIKAFFKTYPEGCPPEGWSTKKTGWRWVRNQGSRIVRSHRLEASRQI